MQLLKSLDQRVGVASAMAGGEALEEEMTRLEFQIMDADNPEE